MPTGFDDRNVIPIFLDRYAEMIGNSWAMDLSLFNDNSTSAVEIYGIFGGFAKMREWIGARQAQTISQRAYSIRNRPFESTLSIPDTIRRRDKTGLLEAYIGDWTQAVPVDRWEDMLIDLINTNGLCYDGNPYFYTAHQFAGETTQSNDVSSTDVPALDVAIPTAPTSQEMYAAVLGLIMYMKLFKDDKGRYMNKNAKAFKVVVATAALATAFSMPMTTNGDAKDTPLTRLSALGYTIDLQFQPALTAATAKIRVYRADGQLKPFILQQEQVIQYELLDSNSEYHFYNHAILMGINDSRGAGYGLYEHGIQGTLS